MSFQPFGNMETDPVVGEEGYGYGGAPPDFKQQLGAPGVQQPPLPKRRLRGDCFDYLWDKIDKHLLMSKAFYFFFFSAFGSLFPLLGVYFKQLGMTPMQGGALVGVRPLIEFCSGPFWANIGDKFSKRKLVMLFSLFCWVAFTLAICFIVPPPASCLLSNMTHDFLQEPYVEMEKRAPANDFFKQRLEGTELKQLLDYQTSTLLYEQFSKVTDAGNDLGEIETDHRIEKRSSFILDTKTQKPRFPEGHVIGKSPERISKEQVVNYDAEVEGSLVKPPFSTIVYRERDVREVFWLLMLLICVGEFFSAPAITLADSATLEYLAEDADLYGRQRMFGSLGWGLSMFFVGIALDHTMAFPDHPCGEIETGEKNYTLCFAVFSVLMSCAFLVATQFWFSSEEHCHHENLPMSVLQSGQTYLKKEKDTPQLSITNENADFAGMNHYGYHQDAVADTVNSIQKMPQSSEPEESQMAKTMTVLRTFGTIHYIAVLYVVWFMGFGIGLVFTFLFWHLQDLGGTPSLFGVASVINHISEIFAYAFTVRLITHLGHIRVLYLGLAVNVGRFLYVSWLKNPWWVLPFEFAQGITHAAVWAACMSYVTQAVPPHYRASAQGILQGLHHALGRGLGAVVGGMLATRYGTQLTFRGYGFACLIVLVIFVAINFFIKDRGHMSHGGKAGHEILEETSVLAPCGVPMNPMSRNLSSSKLDQDAGYQAYGTLEGDQDQYLNTNLRRPMDQASPARGYSSDTRDDWGNKQTIKISGNIPSKQAPFSPQPQLRQQVSDPNAPW